jgi:hypothetical protein
MNARELYELVKPVWDAWPECKPKDLAFEEGNNVWTWVSTEQAADLCIAAMVKWLPYSIIQPTTYPREGWSVTYGAREWWARTLIQALCAACLALKGTQ